MDTSIKELGEQTGRLVAERDSFRDDTEELIANKKKVEFDARMAQM